jgi:2-polyprenyl-3-methyl-5-hydroxy-6-metoxy-1,4-benzoquinol methylase
MEHQIIERGIPAGNWENKYDTRNPVARLLVRKFLSSLEKLVVKYGVAVDSIMEVGCGEGLLAAHIDSLGIAPVKACDFSARIIDIAKKYHADRDISFYVRDIYELDRERDKADLVLCCEVLEHLENPELGLTRLSEVASQYVLLSVPNEPLWRFLNVIRGKYIRELGNTPGHINHWSRKRFLALVSKHMEILEVRNPCPWTMVLGRIYR